MKVRSSIRLESFGGTLFDLRSGKRVYVNQEEAQKIVPYADVQLEDCSFAAPIKIITPSALPTDGFSFADTAFIEITRKCNLRCTHCLNNSGNGPSLRAANAYIARQLASINPFKVPKQEITINP